MSERSTASQQQFAAAELMGGGGCVARALKAAGVWRTEEEAVAALDDQIDGVLAARRRHMPNYERQDVGVEGSIWAAEVVTRAVVAAGFHWQKLRLESDALSQTVLNHESVILDGVLNNAYKSRKARKTVFIAKSSPACNPVDHEPAWRHSAAVVAGCLHDDAFLRAPTPADALWLAGSTPDPERGYMRKILKAYKVTKCPGHGCEICAARADRKRARGV